MSHNMVTRMVSALALIGLLVGTLGVIAASPAHADNIGYQGPGYQGSSDPTSEKPQSKLWHHDGVWWAAMYSPSAKAFTIHELGWGSQKWSDTGVVIDTRGKAKLDVLWDGSKLYVAAAGQGDTAADDARMYRFTYDEADRTYSLDPTFPVTLVSGGMEAIVMDQDTAGQVWVTFTRNSTVYVTHSGASDTSWVAPYPLPVAGADNLSSDDISAVVAFNGQLGVMWGNQNQDTYYFAVHVDGTDDRDWAREVAYSRPEGADDHINIKAIQNDPEGRVFAIVKTSLNDPDDPMNVVLVRRMGGVWDTDNVFGRGSDAQTRAGLVIDSQNDDVYSFAAAPEYVGGTIYMKKVSVNGLLNGNPFGNGLGQVFIQSDTATRINNPTATKQPVNDDRDLVVLASDWPTRTYLHNKREIGPVEPPETSIDSGPSGTVGSTSASFTFSSTRAGATYECRLDNSTWTDCTSPQTYTGLTSGAHTFDVRATAGGDTDATPATRTWTIDTTQPAVLAPVGDATVRQNNAGTNYGGGTNLEADTSPLERSWLKFAVPAPASGQEITKATLRLYATNGTGNGPKVYAAENSWTENGLTWNNQPALNGAAVDDAATVPVNDWIDYDLTSAVTSAGTYSLVNVPDGSDGVVYSSREGAQPPQLVIETAPIDTSPPETSIDSGPSGTVGSTSASFTFSSTRAGATYECRLDNSTWTDCTSPQTYTGLTSGAHTFDVRATAGGDTDATPATRTWTIDTTQPAVLAPVGDATVRQNNAGTNYGGGTNLEADTSPLERSWLKFAVPAPASGQEITKATLRLYATNGTGNGPKVYAAENSWTENGLTWNNQPALNGAAVDDAATVPVNDWIDYDLTSAVTSAGTYSLVNVPDGSDGVVYSSREGAQPPQLVIETAPIDTSPPETSIDSGPSGTVGSTSASFTFSSTRAGATYECRLDNSTWTDCTSPQTYTGLTSGAHTFDVRATAGGDTDATPATRTWTIDTTQPAVLAPVGDATVRQNNAGTNYGGGTNLEADTSPLERSWLKFAVPAPASGQEITKATLRLYATNGTGNGPKVYAAENSWTENGLTWNNQPALNGAAVDDAATVPVNDWIDYDLTSAVTSAGTYSLVNVPDGSDGVVYSSREGAQPPQLVIETAPIDTSPPETSIDSGPSGTVGSTSASFTFSSTRAGATYECRLDNTTWADCTSPQTYTGLTSGAHTFDVRATAGGDTDATPATRTWTIDTTQPAVQTFAAVADTYVLATQPDANKGSLASLVVDKAPQSRTFLGFDVQELSATVESATLRLYASNGTGNGPTVHPVISSWTEADTTWNNQPSTATTVLADLASVDVDSWVDIDVTQAINGNGRVDFALLPESSDGLFMESREAPARQPELIVVTQP